MSAPPYPPPAFNADVPFASLHRVRTPRAARWLARLLLLLFVLAPVALLLVPWQQTVRGRGQVVAFAPTERRQVITARVGGQVGRWHVVEQQRVKAGDRIVDIDDNDPDLAARLDEQKRFLQGRLTAADVELAEQKRAVDAQEGAAKAAVAAAAETRNAARLLVGVAQEAVKNAELARAFADNQFRTLDKLFADPASGGLTSRLTRDKAEIDLGRADTDVSRARAEVERARAAVSSNEAVVRQAEANGATAVATARRDYQRAESGRFDVERQLQELATRIERFRARVVLAPCDGIIQEVRGNAGAGGQYVKEGDVLAEIVPDATDRVVEVSIDGLDAPLVAAHMAQTGRGPHVRLQFQGWPAVQFTGWPSVAVGTFGGRVRQMDPTDDGQGRFRVLVEPDPLWEGDTWPEGLFLRQGNQAIGWVFLNRVSLGYELWRQFNGFPPVIAPKAPDKDKGGKPPKIKV